MSVSQNKLLVLLCSSLVIGVAAICFPALAQTSSQDHSNRIDAVIHENEGQDYQDLPVEVEALEPQPVTPAVGRTQSMVTHSSAAITNSAWAGWSGQNLQQLVRQLADHPTSPTIGQAQIAMFSETEALPAEIVGVIAKRLFDLGQFSMAEAVLSNHAKLNSDPTILRLQNDIFWALGQNEKACQSAQDAVRQVGTAYWQRVMILCHVLANNNDRAMMGQDLLHEQDVVADPVFDALLPALMTGQVMPDKKAVPDPMDFIHWRMLTVGKKDISDLWLQGMPTAVAMMTAKTATISLNTRLRLAENLIGAGLADVQLWQDVTKEIKVTDPTKTAQEIIDRSGIVDRATLFVAIQQLDQPQLKLSLIEGVLNRSMRAGPEMFIKTARLYASMLVTLPALDHSGADVFAKALWLTNHPEKAVEWAEHVPLNADIWAWVYVLSDQGQEELQPAWQEWLNKRQETTGQVQRQMMLTYSLAKALEQDVPPTWWQQAAVAGLSGSTANIAAGNDQAWLLLRSLQGSHNANVSGQKAMLMANIILLTQAQKWQGMPVALQQDLVSGLAKAGYPELAIQAAAEMLLAAGL